MLFEVRGIIRASGDNSPIIYIFDSFGNSINKIFEKHAHLEPDAVKYEEAVAAKWLYELATAID